MSGGCAGIPGMTFPLGNGAVQQESNVLVTVPTALRGSDGNRFDPSLRLGQ